MATALRLAAALAAAATVAGDFDDLAATVVSDSTASCSGLVITTSLRPGRRALVWVRDLDGTKIGVVT